MRYLSIIGLSILFLSCFGQGKISVNYNNLQHIIKTERSSGLIINYTYDELGNRLSKTVTVYAPKALPGKAITATNFSANWEALEGATAYIIDVANDNQFTDVMPAYKQLNVGNVITYPVTGLSANITYYYRVRAVWSGGVSQNSNKIQVTTNRFVPPPKTTANDAVSLFTTGFTAWWSVVPNALGYYLDVSTVSDFSSFLPGFENKDVSNVTEFVLTGLTSGANYYYRVRAYWADGWSENSNIITTKTLIQQQISLAQGWNLISLNVTPENKNLKTIFQPFIDSGKLKKVMDEGGAVIEDWGEINGGWQNTIGEIKNTEGYKINVTSDVMLEITGMPLILPFDIPLTEGWNIISWPSLTEQSGMDVFHDLIVTEKLKKVMDESGFIIEDWGVSNGGWQNYIGNLKPGEGYKVNVTGDCTLTINESGTKSEEIVPELIASTHFIPAYKGNGTDHMNINLLNLSECGILEGDEIGVFDGNICVGSAQISDLTSLIVNKNSISIPVSAADGIEGKNGYSDRNPINLKLFRNGKEYPLTIQPLNQSKTVFEKGNSLFAQVDLATGLEGIEDSNTAKINCYPNPFSDVITIEISLSAESYIQVEVLNQLGQQVKMVATKQLLPGGLHKLTWDARNSGNGEVAPGIYHLNIDIDEKEIKRKIVLSK